MAHCPQSCCETKAGGNAEDVPTGVRCSASALVGQIGMVK